MRKLLIAVVLCVMVFSQNVFANNITVKVNGSVLYSPVPAQIVNDRTVLPMRAIFERLGADVEWIEQERMIFATKDDLFIVMQIDNNKMAVEKIGGEKKIIELDTPPFIQEGSTLVPVRAVAESVGAEVKWNGETRTVDITLK